MSTSNRIYLAVPFDQKDIAKNMGAHWDPNKRYWYVTNQNCLAAKQWPLLGKLPNVLPGEDRSFGKGLFVDLIPKNCWLIMRGLVLINLIGFNFAF